MVRHVGRWPTQEIRNKVVLILSTWMWSSVFTVSQIPQKLAIDNLINANLFQPINVQIHLYNVIHIDHAENWDPQANRSLKCSSTSFSL